MKGARGWAFPRGARSACYFEYNGHTPVVSLCEHKMLFDARTLNDKYNGDDRCKNCIKKLDKLNEDSR